MDVEKYLKIIMDAGYEGSISEYNGNVSLQFWQHPKDAIPVELIERLADYNADPDFSTSLRQLVDWWRSNDEEILS